MKEDTQLIEEIYEKVLNEIEKLKKEIEKRGVLRILLIFEFQNKFLTSILEIYFWRFFHQTHPLNYDCN